jgi:hypothetical protein
MARARTFLTMVGIGFVLLAGGIPTARAGVDAQACCRGGRPCLDLTPEDCAA